MNFDEKSVAKKRKSLTFYYLRKRGTIYTFVFKTALILFLIIFLTGFGLFVGFLSAIKSSTPDITVETLNPKGTGSTLYDDQGNKIITLPNKYRSARYVSLKKIPQHLQNAIITMEDPDFYDHSGVDTHSIINEFLDDVTTTYTYGNCSLITEKLIENTNPELIDKNNLFSRVEYHLRLHYKALSLEEHSSKPEILEYYLNTVGLGDGIIGVEEASQVYWGKSVSELSLSECAILTSMILDPVNKNPLTDPSANKAQRLIILEKMNEDNSITTDELENAIRENSYKNINTKAQMKKSDMTPFVNAALDQVYTQLYETYHISQTKYNTLLACGNLQIYTTQNSVISKRANDILQKKISYNKDTKDVGAVMTIIDHSNGQVKAIADNNKQYDHVINPVTEKTRQPGSLFNVFATYLPGIDDKTLTLASSYEDAPYHYLDSNKKVKSDGNSYQGLTTIRTAMSKAMNIIAARAQSDVTSQTSYDYLSNLGYSHLVEAMQNTNNTLDTDIKQSICSGELVRGVTNLEVAQSVTTLGNEGKLQTPVFFTEIKDKKGNQILENKSGYTNPIKDTTAFLISDTLKNKTKIAGNDTITLQGSSTTNSDYWYTGYAGNLTGTLSLSYADEHSFVTHGMEKKLWYQIMNCAKDKMKKRNLKKPASIVSADICKVSGKLAVYSICNRDPRGNCIRTEYFAPDTIPTTTCNTHVEVTICKKSGMLINNSCPAKDKIQKIFLILPIESKNTLDYKYVLPKKYQTNDRCNVHKGKEIIKKR